MARTTYIVVDRAGWRIELDGALGTPVSGREEALDAAVGLATTQCGNGIDVVVKLERYPGSIEEVWTVDYPDCIGTEYR